MSLNFFETSTGTLGHLVTLGYPPIRSSFNRDIPAVHFLLQSLHQTAFLFAGSLASPYSQLSSFFFSFTVAVEAEEDIQDSRVSNCNQLVKSHKYMLKPLLN
ncbi:hypothetical protein GIB67_035373 [Kingdonia uniflora]|uniref:Uncharacterized protein n=1 Tax=Kingdonia uniflora TaxID=39325 RepID=A0A7J7MMA9_9MAGN|nr:hypothetical protein GIB67_035373 [Kingdonia uniflora]